jgi:hypothetical protein
MQNHNKAGHLMESQGNKTPIPNGRYESSMKSQLKEGSQIISSPTQITSSNIRDF